MNIRDGDYASALDKLTTHPDAVARQSPEFISAQHTNSARPDEPNDTLAQEYGLGPLHPRASRHHPPAQESHLVSLKVPRMGFSVTLMGTIAAAATQGVHDTWRRHAQANARQALQIDPKILQRLTRAEAMTWVHRACEHALQAPAGVAPKVPVLIHANVSLETYAQIKRARGEMLSMREIRGLTGKGQLTLAIMTDTDTLRELRIEAPRVSRRLQHWRMEP